MKNPQTRDKWQHAANLAHAFLLIDAARLYGFITGGPEIDTDRCETIIERAQVLGITPTDELTEPLLAELNGTGRLTAEIRRCRLCGCTDRDCSGCVERTGEPCYWAEPDLCSACG